MRTYRDKFLAHLDYLPVMDIPFLDRAQAAVDYYHHYVVQHEAAAGDLAGACRSIWRTTTSTALTKRRRYTIDAVPEGQHERLELGKREIEREHLGLFLDAYEAATGESFPEMIDSETPDFLGRDARGRVVGIEITQLRFGPDEQHMRRIFAPEPADHAAWWRLLDLIHRKDQTLTRGRWPQCERKILVIMLIDTALDAVMAGTDTDTPNEGGFSEV